MTSRKGGREGGLAKALARVVTARNTVTPILVMVRDGVHMLTAGVSSEPRPPKKEQQIMLCHARVICTYAIERDI